MWKSALLISMPKKAPQKSYFTDLMMSSLTLVLATVLESIESCAHPLTRKKFGPLERMGTLHALIEILLH